jgi:hypothetical protein
MPAFVTKRNGASETSNTVVSGSFTPGAGNLLICILHWMHDNVSGTGMSTPTFSDTAGNTWTVAGSLTLGAAGVRDGFAISVGYCISNGLATTVTTSLDQNRSSKTMTILEYSGTSSTHKLIESATGAGTIATSSFTLDPGDVALCATWTFNGANMVDFASQSIVNTSLDDRQGPTPAPRIHDRTASSTLTGTGGATNNNGGMVFAYWMMAFAELASVEAIAASRRTAILL